MVCEWWKITCQKHSYLARNMKECHIVVMFQQINKTFGLQERGKTDMGKRG